MSAASRRLKRVVAGIGLAAAASQVTLLAQKASSSSQAPAPDASPPRSVWDGAYTDQQAKRGQSLYRRECAVCHGAVLTGGEEAVPLTGAAFTANWNGLTVGDLFDRIRMSMPPTHPGMLSRQQIADVLAYILSVNSFPVGTAELPRETERLRLIRFEATRPESP